ncbi:MAG: 4Fe-4S binding protein [Oscillospiraceae bacterium]|nr:4Fe-4S binding protein [Oscillospiraceae bacterium]
MSVKDKIVCTVAAEDVARVKGLGCLRDKTTADCFNCRVLTRNGKITSAESKAIAEAAEKFGSGEVAMTTRQTVEIQKVPYSNIEPMIEFLAANGLEIGGTGPKVRPVVSCKGTTCIYGLIDTYGLALKIHEHFYVGYHSVALPHKFKIAVGGCPNSCVKPDLNDLGVIGQQIFTPDPDKCRGCKKCAVETACPMKAAKVENGKIVIDADVCNRCGRCIGKCPFGAFEESREGYKVCIGGRWGKKTAVGKPLGKIFGSEDEVLTVIEKGILLFRDEGIKGERFADTVERLGFDYVEKKLLEE